MPNIDSTTNESAANVHWLRYSPSKTGRMSRSLRATTSLTYPPIGRRSPAATENVAANDAAITMSPWPNASR